jgi:hypothetical protein
LHRAQHGSIPHLRLESNVTDPERQKARELIASVEIAIGEIAPRDGANSALIRDMLQALNGLRTMLGLIAPIH